MINDVLNNKYGVVINVNDIGELRIDSVAPINELLSVYDMQETKDTFVSSLNIFDTRPNSKVITPFILHRRKKMIDNSNLTLYYLRHHLWCYINDKMSKEIYKDLKDRRVVAIYGSNKYPETYIFIFSIENVEW